MPAHSRPISEQIMRAMGFKPKARYVWVLMSSPITHICTSITGVYDSVDDAMNDCHASTSWTPRLSRSDTAVEGRASNVYYRIEEWKVR